MSEIKDGDTVFYRPTSNCPHRFRGTVDGEAWMLGNRLVINLRDMEPAYGEYCGVQKTRVRAVLLTHIERKTP